MSNNLKGWNASRLQFVVLRRCTKKILMEDIICYCALARSIHKAKLTSDLCIIVYLFTQLRPDIKGYVQLLPVKCTLKRKH